MVSGAIFTTLQFFITEIGGSGGGVLTNGQLTIVKFDTKTIENATAIAPILALATLCYVTPIGPILFGPNHPR